MATTNNTPAGSATSATAPKIPDVSAEIRANGTLSLSFANGKVIEVDPATLAEPIVKQAILHGLKQKLIDAAAIGRDMVTGRSATVEDKYAAVREVFDRITDANEPAWNKVREAGAGQGQGLLVAALMQLTGKSKDAIIAFLDSKSKEEKAALRKNQKVASIIVELQAASADKDIDTDAMLDDFIADTGEDAPADEVQAEVEQETGETTA